MKLESDYFDKIRVTRKKKAKTAEAVKPQDCDFKDCNARAQFRAPKGRDAEGEYYWFCLDHVRAYNKSYNYFSGMDDSSIQDYQKQSAVGHRPTWKMGVNAKAADAAPSTGKTKMGWGGKTRDPFNIFDERSAAREETSAPNRKMHNMARKSLEALGLDESATSGEIKAKYKLLVKRHHPDANGGDRSLEDRLRQIIQAYKYLKEAGFC